MAEAQCLAHLGHNRDAVEATERALNKSPDNPDVLQAAALVYAVVNDKTSALVHIGKALAKGVQPRWFQLPAFDSLKDDPDYQSLMKKTPEATPSE
jgi:hypothetical protein